MDKPKLICSDLHAPFHKENAIEFMAETQEAYGCDDEIICAGDIADFHSASRFVSELWAMSPEQEYEKFLEFMETFVSYFPKGTLVLGNHDMIPQRQMKEIGLPTSLLRTPNELYGLPDTWKIEPLFHVVEFDGYDRGVLVEHGNKSGGMYGCINTAVRKRTSFAQGHTHAYAGVMYRSNFKDTIFGLNTGCLCDESSLAMKYAEYNRDKGVPGCGVMYSPEHAIFEMMPKGV
jgi:hypothetical protein